VDGDGSMVMGGKKSWAWHEVCPCGGSGIYRVAWHGVGGKVEEKGRAGHGVG